MKKALLILSLLVFAISARAAVSFDIDTVKIDTAKLNKKINKLKDKLNDLTAELAVVQKQIPLDSAKNQEDIAKSLDAQQSSKKAAGNAVGGDVSDAKKAEKLAKKAEDLTDDADDSTRQLKKDRKKLKNLTEDIQDAQKKLAKLQSQL